MNLKTLFIWLVISVGLTYSVSLVRFYGMESLFHDLRMQFDPRSFQSQHFRTVIIPPKDQNWTFQEYKEVFDILRSAEPRAIIWLVSQYRLPVDPKEQSQVRALFDNEPKVYIAANDEANESFELGLDLHPLFKDFSRTVGFYIPMDKTAGAADRRPRRMLLRYDAENRLERAPADLQKLFGFQFNIERFRFPLSHMGTTQIYLKHHGHGAFGNYSTLDLQTSSEKRQDLKDKIVLISDFDKWDHAPVSIYRGLGTQNNAYESGYVQPTAEVAAEVCENIVSGDYVKVPPQFINRSIAFLAIAAMVGVLTWTSPVVALPTSALLMIAVLLAGWAIFVTTNFMVELAQPLVGMAACQYIGLPLSFFRQARRQRERERVLLRSRVAARSAQAEVGLKIALRVAHDLRGPVTALQMMATTQQSVLPPNLRELIEDSTRRLNGLANELLTKYRQGTLGTGDVYETTDLRHAIQSLTSTFRSSYPKVEWVNNLTDRPCFVPMSRLNFDRCLSNVLTNAIEAMDAQSLPRIEVSLLEETESYVVEVTDNGSGLDPQLKDSLFSEGATAGKASGTGLGLHQTQKMMTDAGGLIQLVTSGSSGTRFELRFPKNQNPLQLQVHSIVLVADDDPEILRDWRLILRNPMLFTNPKACLDEIHRQQQRGERFTLITDLIFQGEELTGFDLAAEVQSVADAYLCTSFSESPEVREIARQMGLTVIEKNAIRRLKV